MRGSLVVLRNDVLFVGLGKRAIANTVCITVSASDRASISACHVWTQCRYNVDCAHELLWGNRAEF